MSIIKSYVVPYHLSHVPMTNPRNPQLITEESNWGEIIQPSEETLKYIRNKYWKY